MPIFPKPEEGKPHIETGTRNLDGTPSTEVPGVNKAKEKTAADEHKDPKAWAAQFTFDAARQQSIASMVVADTDSDQKAMTPYLSRIREIIKLYEQERDSKTEPFEGASNISAGDVPIAVENMHPRLFGAVARDPLAEYRAENAPSKRNLRNITTFMNWAYRIDMRDTLDKLDEHVHSTVLYGTQPVWIRWEKIRNVYWDFGEETNEPGDPEAETPTRRVEIIERGAFDNLNIEDFFVPIGESGDIHRMSHCIRRYYLTVSEIDQLIARKQFQKPEMDLHASVDERMKKEDGEEVGRLQATGLGLPEIRARKRLEVLEWHGKFDAENEGFPSECTFTVIRSLKLYMAGRYQPSPDGRRPFEVGKLIPRKNFYFAAGIPEMIRLLAKERDAIHNQRLDAGSVSIIPFGFYRAASGFRPEKIVLQPGTWVPLDDVRDAQMTNFPTPSTTLASEEAMSQAQIEKLSIAGSFQLGRESEIFKSRATAKGTQLVVGQGNIRFNLLGERVKRTTARIFDRLTILYQRYLPPGTGEKVLGNDGKQLFPKGLTRRDLRGRFQAYLTGDTETANKSVEQQASVFVLQAFAENPLVQRSPARMWELGADVLKAFGRDVERVLGKRPPDQQSFLDVVEGMIESINQGYAPEINEESDLVGIIGGLNEFLQSEDFEKLDQGKRRLVQEAITTARGLLVKAIGKAIQQQAQQQEQGQPGQPQNGQVQAGPEGLPPGTPGGIGGSGQPLNIRAGGGLV